VESYDVYDFGRVLQSTYHFASNTLSALYFDLIKDKLYSDSVNGSQRQAIVAVLDYTYRRLLKILAPIIPHFAEEFYEANGGDADSVFLDVWEPNTAYQRAAVQRDMDRFLGLRSLVFQLGEEAKATRNLRLLTEADLEITASGEALGFLNNHESVLRELFGVSSFRLTQASDTAAMPWFLRSTSTDGVELVLCKAAGHQCPRCWLCTSVAEDSLCQRCEGVVAQTSG